MKRLLTLIIATLALQSCSMSYLGSDHHYGYDVPVSPTHVTINIDKQPAWGPYGYDCASYYYMPEINIYYDVNLSLFYYPSGSSWISAQYLPPSYRIYDLFRTYKVVLNYASPWQHNDSHRSQYRRYRDDRSQITISMSNDRRYSKSWENLRPWVDPNRRSNRKNDYQLRTQNQQAGSNKYIEDKRNDGYRVAGGDNGATAGDAYRQKNRTPNNTSSSSSSYREKNNTTPTAPQTDGVSSRAKNRKQSSAEPKSQNKPTTNQSGNSDKTRSNKNSTDKSASSPSPSASYRTNSGSATNTTTRGRE